MLLRESQVGILKIYDQFGLAKSIMLLHDAAEAALGAIADHLNIKLIGNKYVLDYYDLIENEEPSKKVPYRVQIRNLNTVRNNAKHQGIFPDNKAVAHFPATVQALIEELCELYLGIPFDSINLKNLIKDEFVRSYIDMAEKSIGNGEYENSLISLGYAIYYIVESSTISTLNSIMNKRTAKEYEFTKPYGVDFHVRLLEHGVDPYLYHRFRNLTPKIAKEFRTRKVIYIWDKDYGHQANWTSENCQFCLWFAVDTALKFQKERNFGYSIKHYIDVYEDIIEPSGDEAVFWDISKYNLEKTEQTEVFRLEKGHNIVGYAFDADEISDEWFVMSKDLPSKKIPNHGIGFILKEEVRITSRKKI